MQECIGALRRLGRALIALVVGTITGSILSRAALRFTSSGFRIMFRCRKDARTLRSLPCAPAGLATVSQLVRCDIGVPSPTSWQVLTAINKDRGQTERFTVPWVGWVGWI
jgi:hypothetical protein